MKKPVFIIPTLLVLLTPLTAKAHCPLCTVGAGALAVGAAYLGVSVVIVGIFIGAFAIALALWIPRFVKKQYIPHQKPILIALIFLSTIIPIMPLIQEYQSFNIFLFGEYGSLLNRTYMYNRFVVGTIIGALIMYLSPFISMAIQKRHHGLLFPYQGMAITFLFLVLMSLLIQFGL